MNHPVLTPIASTTVTPACPARRGLRAGVALLASVTVLLAACGPDGPSPTAAVPAPGTTTTTTTTVVTTAPTASMPGVTAMPATPVTPPAVVQAAPRPVAAAPVKPHHVPTQPPAANRADDRTVAMRDAEPVAPRPVGQLGNITAIDAVKGDPKTTNGAGAVIGGLLGGVLGHQVGGGSGKDAATVVGAIGGAVAGNNVQKNRDREVVGYRLHITLDNGQSEEVIVPNRGAWNTGDRVRVANGNVRPA